jgi:glycerol-3-phosphate dehydrogenase
MAAETVDVAAKVAGKDVAPSKSHKALLPGARGISHDFESTAEKLAQDADLPKDVALRLANVYGARAPAILEYVKGDRKLAERVCADRDVIYAEVIHSVERELALTVEDVMVRRTSLSLTAQDQGTGAAEKVATLIGQRLGWSASDRNQSLDEYAHTIALSRAHRR